MAHFDVMVCGLGATGCAALHRLAAAGARVLGLDRYQPGHDRGSSHGLTRVIRLGYFEHPSYVPLVRRAYELWRETETAAGRPLLHVTGIAEIGPPDGILVRGTLASAQRHGLRHEVLDASELMARYSAFVLPRDVVGVVQPDGGFLEVEPAIAAFVALAAAAGAENPWRRDGEGARAVRRRRTGRNRSRGLHRAARDRRRRAVDVDADRRIAAAGDASGHGMVRTDGRNAVRARLLPGVPGREPSRRALRCSAGRRTWREGRQASPPRRDGRSRNLRSNRVGR